jgi:hypothetical protein
MAQLCSHPLHRVIAVEEALKAVPDPIFKLLLLALDSPDRVKVSHAGRESNAQRSVESAVFALNSGQQQQGGCYGVTVCFAFITFPSEAHTWPSYNHRRASDVERCVGPDVGLSLCHLPLASSSSCAPFLPTGTLPPPAGPHAHRHGDPTALPLASRESLDSSLAQRPVCIGSSAPCDGCFRACQWGRRRVRVVKRSCRGPGSTNRSK